MRPLSWSDIGDQLGDVSKQRLHQRFKDIAGTQDVSLVTDELRKDSDHGQVLATKLYDAVRLEEAAQGRSTQAPADAERRVLLDAAGDLAAALRSLARAMRHSSNARVATYRREAQLALRAADHLGRGGGELLGLVVLLARHGRSVLSWQAVAECLGESKQAVHYRFNRSVAKANVGALAGQVRSQAAESNELAIQLEESVRSGRDQHREALKQDKLRRAEARRFPGGSSPLGPEPYDPAVEAWVRELADRGLLARPDKNGPPEDYESPRDYFNSRPTGRFTTRLSSVQGLIGYDLDHRSYFAEVPGPGGPPSRYGRTTGLGHLERYESFLELVEVLPLVDWTHEAPALQSLARFVRRRFEELACVLPVFVPEPEGHVDTADGRDPLDAWEDVSFQWVRPRMSPPEGAE